MKNLLLSFVFILFGNLTIAQKTYYQPVIIYSSTKNSIVKKNGKEIKLDSLLVCQYNERLEVVKGKIRLFDGENEELELTSGEHIFIKKNKQEKETNHAIINKISRFINEPSVYLPNLYNSERSHLFVFPLESKVANQANIKLYFLKKYESEMTLKFYYSKDSLIWQTTIPGNTTFTENIKLVPNHKYFWRLYVGSIGIRGKFELLSKEQAANLKITEPKSKSDYLNTYFIYLENGCKYDAMAILSKARKRFPDCKIFKSFANKIQIKI